MARNARAAALRAQQERIARALHGDPEDEAQKLSGAGSPTMAQREAIVENAIQQAIRRGEFDNLPGAGKPLQGLGTTHDPDWWIRRKIEQEQLSGLGPPALMLRVENTQLDDRLDRLFRESQVREVLEDFNARIIEARRQLQGGPPVVTPLRDVEAEIAAWRARRETREAEARAQREAEEEAERARRAERRRRLRFWRPAATCTDDGSLPRRDGSERRA